MGKTERFIETIQDLVAAKGEGVEEGKIRSLGLGDANYYT